MKMINKNNLTKITLAILAMLTGVLLTYINSFFKPTYIATHAYQPYNANKSLQRISSLNVASLMETLVFNNTTKGKVIKISFLESEGYVLVLDETGYLSTWDIVQKKEVNKIYIGRVKLNSTNFSVDGTRLLTPYSITEKGDVNSAAIWNTRTGNLIFCNSNDTAICRGQDFWDIKGAEGGYFLDPSGQWLLGYYLNELSPSSASYRQYRLSNTSVQNITTISEDFASNGIVLLNPDKYASDKNAEVVAITTDLKTNYIAYALANGIVRFVSGFDPLIADKDYLSRDFTEGYQKNERLSVVDLKIDSTRTWLAVLNNKELLVWNLQRGFLFPLIIKNKIEEGITLSFDIEGEMLFIGTKNNIIVYNLRTGKEVESINAHGVSSLYITRDNRLLIWGDIEGSIHILSVSEK